MKKKFYSYWIVTVIFGVLMLLGGVGDVLFVSPVAKSVVPTYPEYFIRILGVCKILGSIVLILPFFKRLKEWAYAGFTIDLGMAVIAHIFWGNTSGFNLIFLIVPLVLLLLMFVSYNLYHKKIKEE